jgi:serine/threonine protein kinase
MTPPLLKGIRVFNHDPFRIDFVLDKGDEPINSEELKKDSARLVRYFFASLTVPEKDLWVNLSPYEKDHIIPQAFGETAMGRDLLAQDHILKQVTASLLHPDSDPGREFWKKVYAQMAKLFGTTTVDIPVNTFNKVWIIPEEATVQEDRGAAFVAESKLKVMLESDYLTEKQSAAGADMKSAPTSELAKQILQEVIIPALEHEVNESADFAPLRQVYNSLILATWYKRKIKESLLARAYVDQKKIRGLKKDGAPGHTPEEIWAQYVATFKKGAYNLIREEYDPATGTSIPRKYFSGGASFDMTRAYHETPLAGAPQNLRLERAVLVSTRSEPLKPASDKAQTPDPGEIMGFINSLNPASNYTWASTVYHQYYYPRQHLTGFVNNFNEAITTWLQQAVQTRDFNFSTMQGLSWLLGQAQFLGQDILSLLYQGGYDSGREILRLKLYLPPEKRPWVNLIVQYVLNREQPHYAAELQALKEKAKPDATTSSQRDAYKRALFVRGPETFMNYSIIETLEHSGRIVVYRAAKDGQFFIIKRFLGQAQFSDEHHASMLLDLSAWMNESTVYDTMPATDSLSRPYLPTFVESAMVLTSQPAPENTRDHYIVLNEIPGESLLSYLNNHPELNLQERLHLYKKILVAFQALHSDGYVHLDIKPPNIIITPEGDVRIIDLALARRINARRPNLNGHPGTRGFQAPELLPSAPSPAAVWAPSMDIYALGMMLLVYILNPLSGDGWQYLDGFNDAFRFSDQKISQTVFKTVFFSQSAQSTAQEMWARIKIAPSSKYIISQKILEITKKAVSQNPDERYQTIADLLKEIDSLLASLDPRDGTDASQTPAMKGGIDLDPAGLAINVEPPKDSVAFTYAPKALEAMESAAGIDPVIINIQPYQGIKAFLSGE